MPVTAVALAGGTNLADYAAAGQNFDDGSASIFLDCFDGSEA